LPSPCAAWMPTTACSCHGLGKHEASPLTSLSLAAATVAATPPAPAQSPSWTSSPQIPGHRELPSTSYIITHEIPAAPWSTQQLWGGSDNGPCPCVQLEPWQSQWGLLLAGPSLMKETLRSCSSSSLTAPERRWSHGLG